MVKRKGELLIDVSPLNDFLLTADNEPIWSVKTQSELNGLQKLAKVFGSSLKKVTGEFGYSKSIEEEVVGLGKEVEKSGLLYAHLTKRKYRSAENIKDLSAGNIPSIVVTKTQFLDNELLEFLYTPRTTGKQSPGIICSDDPQLLRQQVLVRSAAAHLSENLNSLRIDVIPSLPINHLKKLGYEIVGGKASPQKVRDAIGNGAGLLRISTHSDGIDTKLGKDLTLCSMLDLQTKPNEIYSPTCHATQFCHRHKVSLKEILQSDKLVSPEGVVAGIFILHCCAGLRLPSGYIDVNWSLGPRFFNSSSLGAILTTWELVITTPAQTDILTRNLSAGVSVGKALALFNNSNEAKKFGRNRMCLLGDPRVRIPVRESNSIDLEQRAVVINKNAKFKETTHAKPSPDLKTEFFDFCFTNLKNLTSDEQEVSIINQVLAKISEYEIGSFRIPDMVDNSAKLSMQIAIMNYILDHRSQFYHAWLLLADKFSTRNSTRTCQICKQMTNITKVRIKLSKEFSRNLIMCPNCGILKDSPSSFNLELLLKDKTIKLIGKLPQKNCTIKVVAATSDDNWTKWDWPSDGNGKLLRTFQISNFKSPSFVNLCVIVIWDQNYAVLRQFSRLFQADIS
jgi:hypothetical protein